jgi:hypothetical protein
MVDPFTIRIYAPEGVRIIDRMNWTGIGVAFLRAKWLEVRQRPDFARTGIYIFVGDRGEPDDLPTIDIRQA